MNHEKKAKELVEKFKPHVIFTLTDGSVSDYIRDRGAKECALIAVDEVLVALRWMAVGGMEYLVIKHYEEVRKEIEEKQSHRE